MFYRLFLFLLSFLSVASASDYVNKYYWVSSNGPDGGTAYYRYKINISFVVVGGKLPSGNITLTNLAGNIPLVSSSLTTTFAVTAGATTIPSREIIVPAIGKSGGTLPTFRNIRLAVTTDWGGQFNELQFEDMITREDVTVLPPAQVDRVIQRTVYIKPKDFEMGQWSLVINTRSRIVKGYDYMVCWNSETTGGTNKLPPSNPPSPASFLHNYVKQVPETVPMPVRVFRREWGGTWGLIWSGSVPYGTTFILNDYPSEPLPETPPADPANPSDPTTPPAVGNGTNPDGTQDGTQTPTTGNGTTPGGATGGVPGTGTGGTGTGTGGSGSGTGISLTQAEVQQAVRAGVTQASEDSNVSGLPDFSLEGIAPEVDVEKAQSDANALKSRFSNIMTKVNSLKSSFLAIGDSFSTINLPTVGSATLKFEGALPIFGPFSVSLEPYAAYIAMLRALLLAILTIMFFKFNYKLVKGAF